MIARGGDQLDLFTLRQNLLLLALDLLDALPWRWKVFGHSAAEVFDGVADFLADGVMRQVGIFLSLHIVTAQLGLGLGGAEEIGRQLFDAHVIQDVLGFLQALLSVDVLGLHAAVEPHVSVVRENAVITPASWAASASDLLCFFISWRIASRF